MPKFSNPYDPPYDAVEVALSLLHMVEDEDNCEKVLVPNSQSIAVVKANAQALISCCRRLNELFRYGVRDACFYYLHPSTAITRFWNRYPYVEELSLLRGCSLPLRMAELPHRGRVGLIPKADSEDGFLCAIVRPCLKSLFLNGLALRIATLRSVVETCVGLETLCMNHCHVLTDTPNINLPGELQGPLGSFSFGKCGKTLKKLSVSNSVFSSVARVLPVNSLFWYPLTQLHALESLGIYDMVISEESFASIATMSSLQDLSLSGTNLYDSTASLLFSALSHLRSLSVRSCRLLTADAQKIPLPPSLEKLDVASTRYFAGAISCSRPSAMAPDFCPYPKELCASECDLERVDFFLSSATGIKKLELVDSCILNSANFVRLSGQLEVLNLAKTRGLSGNIFSAVSRLASLEIFDVE